MCMWLGCQQCKLDSEQKLGRAHELQCPVAPRSTNPALVFCDGKLNIFGFEAVGPTKQDI